MKNTQFRDLSSATGSGLQGAAPSRTAATVGNDSVVFRGFPVAVAPQPLVAAVAMTGMTATIGGKAVAATEDGKTVEQQVFKVDSSLSAEEEIKVQEAPWVLEPLGAISYRIASFQALKNATRIISETLLHESIAFKFVPRQCAWRCSGAGVGSFVIVMFSLSEREGQDRYSLCIEDAISNMEKGKSNKNQVLQVIRNENALAPFLLEAETSSSRCRPSALDLAPRSATKNTSTASATKISPMQQQQQQQQQAILIEAFGLSPFADVRKEGDFLRQYVYLVRAD